MRLLIETEEIVTDSKWIDVKEIIRDDPKYDTKVLTSKDREDLFDEYIKTMKKDLENLNKKLRREQEV